MAPPPRPAQVPILPPSSPGGSLSFRAHGEGKFQGRGSFPCPAVGLVRMGLTLWVPRATRTAELCSLHRGLTPVPALWLSVSASHRLPIMSTPEFTGPRNRGGGDKEDGEGEEEEKGKGEEKKEEEKEEQKEEEEERRRGKGEGGGRRERSYVRETPWQTGCLYSDHLRGTRPVSVLPFLAGSSPFWSF